MTTTIKITALSEIGSNLATSTVVPVVNMAGTPTTQKTTVGNIANLALTQAGNAYPAAALATLAQTVTNAAQPNITSVGTLTGLTSTGNVTFTSAGNVNLGPVGNVKITGGSSGQILSTDGAGNLSWVNDSTTYGNSNVAAYLPTYTGNLSAGNASLGNLITANYANIVYDVNANVINANYLYGDGSNVTNVSALVSDTVTNAAQPNITSVGTLTDLTMAGNIIPDANVTYNLGNNTNRWNNLYLSGNTIVLGDAVLTANANALIVQTPDGGNFVLEGNANTTFGNIVGVNLNGNSQTWLAGNGTFANISVPNVGNIATINLDGNAGNILYGNGAFAASPSVSLSGDGGNLSNINGANVNGIVANANISDYINVGRVNNNFSFHVLLSAGDGDKDIHVDDSDNLQYNPNSGLLTAVRVDAQNFVGNLYYSSGYVVANVDGIGNIATINLNGNGSQVLAGNGAWVAQSGGGNASLPLANGNSNIDIATANGPVTLTSAGQTWTIGTDGSLTAPNNSNIYPAGNNFNVFTPPAGSVQFYSDGGNYSWSLDGFGVMNLPFASAMSNTALVYSPGNLRLDVGANNFMFTDTGTVVFPTLTVDLHNGGNQNAQTLQFGDDTQQAIITGPTPAANVNAQRLIIQGQRGNGTGEGGDVYFWAGDSDTNGGDIKIYAGDADSATGTGGYINIDAGNGPDGGGQLSLSGGYSSNGFGGQIFITPGASGNANGAQLGLNGGDSGTGDGGEVNITGGLGQTNGGPVNITGGQSALGLPTYGNVVINSGASTWTFNNAGNLVLAGGNSVIQSIANSSLDPTLPNVSTMTLTPDANYTSQVLVLDPTAPGHIHLRAYASSNIDEPSANIFLGGENTAFEITSGANNEARIHSNNYTWTFGNDGNLQVAGDVFANTGASPAPTLYGFSSLQVYDQINVGGITITSADGTNGQVLTTYGNGVTHWSTVSGGGTPAGSNNEIQFNSNGAFGASGNYTFTDTVGGGSVEVGNELLLLGNGTIGTANNNLNLQPAGNLVVTASAYNWTFDIAGNLTLPGNTFAVNYANGSQASAPLVDVLNTNGLTTVFYPTFVENRTDGQIVRADVDLSYRTDTNTLTVGNITGNTNGYTLGYLNIPQVVASNTTLALSDAGKHYYSTTAGNLTVTIPNNATTSFATGTAINIVVQAAGNVLVNAASGVTLYLAGNSSAANRVVGTYGMATLLKVASDTWFINGTGVS